MSGFGFDDFFSPAEPLPLVSLLMISGLEMEEDEDSAAATAVLENKKKEDSEGKRFRVESSI